LHSRQGGFTSGQTDSWWTLWGNSVQHPSRRVTQSRR
jgi:hypothetical protein